MIEETMKRLALAALLLLVAVTTGAQDPSNVYRGVLASAWDLDGEAADNDQIVVVGDGALTDSKTFTITAQPDTCRLIDITVTDGDSSLSAGALTVAGTDCLGEVKSCSFTFASGGSGVKTLTCTDGEGAYLRSVSSVTTGVLTGEGGADTVIVGYTSNSVNGWPMYGGALMPRSGSNVRRVDPLAWFDVNVLVTTSAALSTTVAAVTASSNPFANVAVGDLLIFQIQGNSFTRKVTARASADSVTINQAVNIPAAGMAFRYKKFYFSTNPQDLVAIPVAGYRTLLIDWSIDANANTGGVVTLLECTQERTEFPGAQWVTLETNTVASGSTQVPNSESINLELLPYSYCRFGFRFGTGDDGDGAPEDINATFTLIK